METLNQPASPEESYHVLSVEKAERPAGIKDGNWYRYEIALGRNTLVGNRRGTLQQVTQYAEDCARNMSERIARGKRKKTG
ncbi:MAG: hypothetical protein OEZ10_02280 [Gammaproteobacteria bacterium]|nr:hypothetical protein [Gammaproteobacteria bacterium]